MKNTVLLLIIWLGCALGIHAAQHPCIYVSPADRATIQQKVETEPWAKEAFAKIRAKVEKYADWHVNDPQWIS